MTIKAAFFDIDGTLVSFRTHRIPQSTIHAIAEAKQRGVKIFISTGRPVALINNIKEVEQLVEGYIAFNGAYCFIGNDEIATTPLPAADVIRMVDDATRRDYCVIVCGKNQVAIHNYKPIFNEIFVEAARRDEHRHGQTGRTAARTARIATDTVHHRRRRTADSA